MLIWACAIQVEQAMRGTRIFRSIDAFAGWPAMYGERPPPARAHMPGSRGFLCAVSRTYIRDGRAPVPKDPRTSALMSRIRPRDTGPERALRQGLMARGLSGYRLHPAHVPGRPDVAFIGLRVAVFVHGCFW